MDEIYEWEKSKEIKKGENIVNGRENMMKNVEKVNRKKGKELMEKLNGRNIWMGKK